MTGLRRGLGLVSFVLAFWVSLVILFTPGSAVPTAPPGTDKVVHLCLFAGLVVTAVLAGLAPVRAAVLGLGYGALSEVLQGVLTGLHRSGGVQDWLADAAGVLVGLLAVTVVRRRRALRGPER